MHKEFEAGKDYDGVVKFWNEKKGFGFIMVSGYPDVFAHYSAIAGGDRSLHDGQAVKVGVEKGEKGWKANEVLPV